MATDTNIAPIPYKTPLTDRNGLLSVPWIAWFKQLFQRVGGNDASLLDNPMVNIGDMIYGGGLGSPTRLIADTSNTRKFLRIQSVLGIAAAPAWDLLQAGDIPALNYVTSVAMTVPTILTVAGSPITSSGTLALSLATQLANLVFAGPTSGGSATPSFRALVAADIPALSYVTSVGLTMPGIFSVSGSPVTSSGTLGVSLANQSANTLFAGPSSGGASTPSFRSAVYADISPGVKVPTVQKFTSGSGTYTLPTNPSPIYIRVRMVGGGGGGSGSNATATSGSAGGNTTFGTTLLVANGGQGGTYSANAGAGGTASLGTGPIGIALNGATGQGGSICGASPSIAITGGNGGSTPFGGAGGGGALNLAGQSAQANTGSGGGGGGGGSASGFSGTGGSAGGYVDAIITSPSATYAYAVGGVGTNGSAGTGGFAGGSGAAGLIEVTEYYQ